MAITPANFSKIWASNADTPEYTFNEADYLKGWDFVGNLPPTRAQWNAIQKCTDEKMKYVFDNFGAPLSASTAAEMTMQNRVYVYTGSETGYTAGHWYYWNGSAWTDGGVYNSNTVQVDPTLTISGAAADANITGVEIGNARTAIADATGRFLPHFEIGNITFSSTNFIFRPTHTNAIYTPEGRGIPFVVNMKILLKDKENYKIKVGCINLDGTKAYSSFGTNDIYFSDSYKAGGTLYLVIAKTNDDTITSVFDTSDIIEVLYPESDFWENELKLTYGKIMETKHFPSDWFSNGEFSGGRIQPTFRPNRCGVKRPLVLPYNLHLQSALSFRFYYSTFDSDGNQQGQGWYTSLDVPANTKFSIVIARVHEDALEVADVPTFVETVVVTTDLRQQIDEGGSGETDPSDTEAINAKIQTYMNLFYASNNADFYTFFTDPHLMGTNGTFDKADFKTYMDTISGVFYKTSANHVICGGDWLNNGDTKAQASAKLGYVDGMMRKYFGDNYYPVVGNHDFNYLGVDSENTRLTEANWVQPSAMHNIWFNRFEHCYYSFKRNNVRKYILDTLQDYDNTSAYIKTELDWLASELRTNDDTHSVIVMHIFYLSGTTIPQKTHAIGQIVQAYNAHTTCTLTSTNDGYDKTYDFSGTTGHIDYILVGHSHQDFTLTYGGVPVIATLNTQNGGVPSFDMVFTDYDNNKVHLVRVGTGSDREIAI